MTHPYLTLPASAFWRTGVAGVDRHCFAGLYRPKAPLTRDTRVATAGSCFAQHIGAHLRLAGCTVLDAEPKPFAMPDAMAKSFGYGMYSARYGNIYTSRQLLDLLHEITSGTPDPRFVWQKQDRFFDALRPTVEPEGMDSAVEVIAMRRAHLRKSADLLRQTDLLIFTLGLTETWVDRATGRAFPVCPGVVAGTFDPQDHAWVNLTHAQVLADLVSCLTLLQAFNPAMHLLLTVSPVPLTATASGDHVLSATSWSKSTLRAAAGEFAASRPDVDYMPSYELITHPAAQPLAGGSWFDPNLRSVSAAGVARVMQFFLSAHQLTDTPLEQRWPDAGPADVATSEPDDAEDAVNCDEVLLDAFATPAAPQ